LPVKCQNIINLIERVAPKSLAEDWDNAGLNIGNPAGDINGVLVTLDVNFQTVEEAVALGANLIVCHHPVIFKPLKSIRSDLPQGNLLTELVKRDISVYCAHTNMDSAREGVNQALAELLQLEDIEVLSPSKADGLYKIVVFIPEDHEDAVRDAMTRAGAGWIGNYSDCTFSVHGTGTFKATEGCNPFIGEIGALERAAEVRLETVVREKLADRVIREMIKAHPYEEVAYDLYPLANQQEKLGLGRIGKLPQRVRLRQFMDMVKDRLDVPVLRYGGDPDAEVRKIAVCGGSGASLIHTAVFTGAEVFLTGDLKYHESQEAVNLGLSFVDAGHYATEFPVVRKLSQLLTGMLKEEGVSVPVHVSNSNSDVFRYY